MATISEFSAWLRTFVPAPIAGSRRELLLGSIGAGVGLLVGEWLCHVLLGDSNPWFLAPMAATAVLLFVAPASAFAQPWAVLLGNVLSGLVGVACHKWLGATPAAATLATVTAVALMASLRCLHPPGAAIAMTAVLGGPAVYQLGFGFAGWLVGTHSLLLVLVAIVFNNVAGRRYPHVAATRPHPHGTADPLPSERLLLKQDVEAALAASGEVLDVGVDDLEDLLARAQLEASRRRFGEVRCRDIMARDVVVVRFDAAPEAAWILLEGHALGALPVVDAEGRLAGIVAVPDFFVRGAARPRLRVAARVDEIMTRDVRVAHAGDPIADLVEAFSDGGLHHLPVVDDERRVVGVVTQSDLVAALFQAGPAAPGERALLRA